MAEFLGLRSKMCSFKSEEKKKKKGMKESKVVVRNKISLDEYKTVLFSKTKEYRTMNLIRLYKHTVYSETVNKVAESANDDKRIIFELRCFKRYPIRRKKMI